MVPLCKSDPHTETHHVSYELAWLCRNSWEYKLARRLILSAAAVAAVGAATILIACDFDDARAAAVLTSIPRTLNSAGVATIFIQEWPSSSWTFCTMLIIKSSLTHSQLGYMGRSDDLPNMEKTATRKSTRGSASQCHKSMKQNYCRMVYACRLDLQDGSYDTQRESPYLF